MKQPITLYLIGFPGSGKYTIAKELAKFGYKVIDNHLINNPIFSLLDLDGIMPIPSKAWQAIGKIREAVFHFITQHPAASYVFTNVLLEDPEDRAFYERMIQETERRGSLFIPIKLRIAPHEHEKRIKHPERKEKFKAISFSAQDKQKGLLQIEHPHVLELDVTDLSAAQAASMILDFVKEIENSDKQTTMHIHFKKATLAEKDLIFSWLDKPHVQEFWDNSPGHREDILNFMNGRKAPSTYANGIFTYWIGYIKDAPYCLLMTSEITLEDNFPEEWFPHLSKTGKTFTLDFMIGSEQHLGKGLAAPTLRAFTSFINREIDKTIDTFIIDPAETNPRAKHVYEKSGFEMVVEFLRKEGYFKGLKHFLMVKKLNIKSPSHDTHFPSQT